MTGRLAEHNRPAGLGALLPPMAVVFVVFLVTGAALPVLPLHVHQTLGLGTFAVGFVAGSQFAAALVSQIWAGRSPTAAGRDGRCWQGSSWPRHRVSSILPRCAFWLRRSVRGVAEVGRAVLGAGENFVITGAQSWAGAVDRAMRATRSPGRHGSFRGSGRRSPARIGDHAVAGLGGVAFARFSWRRLRSPCPPARRRAGAAAGAVRPRQDRARSRFTRIGLAFASLGFGAMTASSAALRRRGWEPAWLRFTVFAIAFIAARVLLGGLADRIGGARVRSSSRWSRPQGLCCSGHRPGPASASPARRSPALATLSYTPASASRPCAGHPRRARPRDRRLFRLPHVALGFLTPALGLLAQRGLGSIFPRSAVLALCAVPIAARLRGPAGWTDSGGGRRALPRPDADRSNRCDARADCARWRCRRRSGRRSARSAGRRRRAPTGRSCRSCPCRGRAPCRCRWRGSALSAVAPSPISVAPLTGAPTLPSFTR